MWIMRSLVAAGVACKHDAIYQPIQRLTDLEESTIVGVQLKEETCNGAGRRLRTETRARRCGNCGKARHNARSCQIVVEMPEEGDSE